MWYYDFIDTVKTRYDNSDSDINKAIGEKSMMLSLMVGREIILSQTQAFDSKIILANIADNNFKNLLDNRKIAFKSYNNKQTVKEAFISSLEKRGAEKKDFFNYSYSPYFNDGSIDDLKGKRDLALQYFKDKNPDSVDDEIKEYCDMIQCVSESLKKTEVGGIRKASLSNLIKNNKYMLSINLQINNLLNSNSEDRSYYYEEIKKLDLDEEDKITLKDYIDVCYNNTVGYSLTSDENIVLTGYHLLNQIENKIIEVGPFNIYEDKLENLEIISWEIVKNILLENLSVDNLAREVAKYTIKEPDNNIVKIGIPLFIGGLSLGTMLVASIPGIIIGIIATLVGLAQNYFTNARRLILGNKLKKCFKIKI